ncbi:MAG: acyl-CoA dehydrogenase [Acidobacteria bacterium RIFCSPLOWO2_02_FULL_67_36]|nr:MAG: acyl-CoA dehydrogenase [Acidobacteria bacterium RIFCSPLOWO2_02_FULL_67_36]OFW18905.1 MAG: acyl-CoA dehydrogenase [Acidobacteria bacterium RIFCSPLOWO2_12_FULL_66_21]
MTTVVTRGGSWLIEEAAPGSIFTREKRTEEQRMIGQTAEDFMWNEVVPAIDRLETKDWAFARALIKQFGELGLLGVDVPEALGGVELDKVSAIVVGEAAGISASFAATFGAQTGLAITPLLCFGTEEQQKKYVPRLVSGEILGAYALSESGSGSDALAAKARATRQPDGSFTLSGEKMWITNGGFADLFIVFAKVDGEAFTAFLVERGPGVTSGNEEHKMGLFGSSTTPLILQDAKVPAENVLGEIGKGHKVAFNVLNYGRFKLGAMCSGGARAIVGEAAKYALERRQFGQPIANFGAIKHKLAEMAIREYAVESMLYRTAGLIDAMLQGSHANEAVLAALEEFAIEASILKVASSEMIDYVVDENVQIHGGNGFVRDYPAERHYRDARVNRIFEGTNEINRMLIPGMLIRRALKGGLPLIPAAKKLQDEILQPSMPEMPSDEPLENERRAVAAMKKAALMILGTAMQTYGEKLTDQQEVLVAAADIIIDVFAAESVLLRAADAGDALHQAAAQVFVTDAAGRVEIGARTALAAMSDGDTLRTLLAALRRVMKITPVNTVRLRREVAERVLAGKRYPL